jgi:hypothetical protein
MMKTALNPTQRTMMKAMLQSSESREEPEVAQVVQGLKLTLGLVASKRTEKVRGKAEKEKRTTSPLLSRRLQV